MAVGHTPPTGTRQALHPILKVLGSYAISAHHLGDLGNPFGMIIFGYKHFVDREALKRNEVGELTRLYKLVNSLVEYHETKNEKIPKLEKRIAVALKLLPDWSSPSMPADTKDAKAAAKKQR